MLQGRVSAYFCGMDMGAVLSRAARRRSARLQGRQGAGASEAPPENGASHGVACAFVLGNLQRACLRYTRASCIWVPLRLRILKLMSCKPPGACVRKHAVRFFACGDSNGAASPAPAFKRVTTFRSTAKAAVLDWVSCFLYKIFYRAMPRTTSEFSVIALARIAEEHKVSTLYAHCFHSACSPVSSCRCVWRAAQRVRPGLCGRRVGWGQR